MSNRTNVGNRKEIMGLYAFKTRLIRYTVVMTLVVIAAQVAVYWRTGFDAMPVYVVLVVSWFMIAAIGIAHLLDLISLRLVAMSGLFTVSALIAVTPILHPTDVLHPTWYLVLVLFSYIFFSRKLSLIIMLVIYAYFLVYALYLMPGTYNFDEIVTLTASILVTGALCSAVSRESGELYQRLAVAANTDPLTGLWNRRGVEKLFGEIVTNNQDKEISYSVAVLDLDNFKLINDKLGHKTGDHVICLAADLIRDFTRDRDIAARLGGEEFLIILPQDAADNIKKIANRIRTQFETRVLPTVGENFRNIATLSVGVVHGIPSTTSLSEAMQLGDRMMYVAKQKGRNTVATASYNDSLMQGFGRAQNHTAFTRELGSNA